MKLQEIIYYFIAVIFLAACKKNNESLLANHPNGDGTLFQIMDSKETGIQFENKVVNSEKFNIFNYRNFYNGGGVAIGDINNDGLADVFFTANMSDNKLFLNKGNFKFEDITHRAIKQENKNWSTGVVMVDINQDGWLDIYVCNAGILRNFEPANQLFINNKDLTFTERAKEYGLDNKGYTTHASFFDYDHDGDLDAYILNNSFIPVSSLNYNNRRDLPADKWDVKDFLKGGGDKLLRNDNGHFVDVTKQAGIFSSLIGFGLGISTTDVNNDGWIDLYISNDFYEKDYLYINNKNGTFTEDLENRMSQISMSSMGSDAADIDNDGNIDIFATDMLPEDDLRLKTTSSFENIDVHNLKRTKGFYNQYVQNTLQLNDGTGHFKEIAHMTGVSATDWSWGALIFDADNDQKQDLLVCNGIYKDVIDQDFIDFFADDIIQGMVLSGKKKSLDSVINKMPSTPIKNRFFINHGNLSFEDNTDNSGLGTPTFSNGAAYGDLDNDGDLDLVINNLNQPSFVYKNTTKNEGVIIELKYKNPNINGIGSKVNVYSQGSTQVKELIPARGFQSSCDYKLVFAKGSKGIDSIKVCWPDMTCTLFTDVKDKKNILIEHSAVSGNKALAKVAKVNTIFKEIEMPGLLPHVENEYEDFHFERGIFQRSSTEGPAFAKTDLNGDGSDDFFIGAAFGKKPQLFLSTTTGYKLQSDAITYSDFEDTAAAFLDVDGDGDQDLMVGSGGNEKPPLTREMQDRIYLNEKGKFILSPRALPTNGMNTSVVLPFDYDSDGDIDIFVGSSSYPKIYGKLPDNYLYKNDGRGMFTNVAKGTILEKIGFVTDASLIDIDNDKKQELLLSCQWGSIKIIKFLKSTFQQVETTFSEKVGMWSSVHIVDIDNDGDSDIVAGNMGKNSYLSRNKTQLWVGDFDKNETEDCILTRSVDGKEKPIFMKREFMEQLPSLKKGGNLLHKVFSDKSVQELLNLPKDAKPSFRADYYSSCLFNNDGKGKFSIQELPPHAQVSNLSTVLHYDVNNDNAMDLIPAGNKDVYKPQFGQLVGFDGEVLIQNKNGSFTTIQSSKSGLDLRGIVKKIAVLNHKNGEVLAVIKNNKLAKFYKVNR
jgi:enediyne biosynthesis protein E4